MSKRRIELKKIRELLGVYLDETYAYKARPPMGGQYWRVVYYGLDAEGKRAQEVVRLPFDGVKRARDHVAGLQTDITREQLGVASDETLGDYLDFWLRRPRARKGRRPSPRTLEGYRNIVETHLKPHLGHLKIDALDAETVSTFYREQEERGFSAQTVLHHHRVLYRAMRDAVAYKKIAANPLDHEELERPGVEKAEQTGWLSDEGIAGLLRSAGAQGDWFEVAIVLGCLEGLRAGEVCGLQWKDVDTQNRQIVVRRSVEHTSAGGMRLKPPKSGKPRTVPLDGYAAEVLERWKAERAEASLDLVRPQAHVIAPEGAEYFSPKQVSSRWRSWRERRDNRAAFGGTRYHDLRHTAASFWLREGNSLLEVSRWLGHSTIQITADTYGHLVVSPDAAERLTAATARILGREPVTIELEKARASV